MQFHQNTQLYYVRSYIKTKLPEQKHVFLCALVLVLLWQLFFLSTVPRRAGLAGASLAGNETADSIIRSDGKSLCKVFCIITYQSQNSHPQILWVTKHQQLPHYCPPKSSPTNDKKPKKEWRKVKKKKSVYNLSWGDWIFISIKSKEDYSWNDNLFTYS